MKTKSPSRAEMLEKIRELKTGLAKRRITIDNISATLTSMPPAELFHATSTLFSEIHTLKAKTNFVHLKLRSETFHNIETSINTQLEEVVKIKDQLFRKVADIKKDEAAKPYDFSFSDSTEQQLFFKELRRIENDSIESIAESLMDPAPDNKRFMVELIEWMHASRIEDVVVPETDDKVSMILSNKGGASIKVSARPSTNGEFRAEVFRKFIRDAQQNPQKLTLSVFDGVEQYLREFANNPSYVYLQRIIEEYFLERIEANVFDSQTEVYGNLRAHVRKCLLKAGTLYSQEKIRDPRLVLQQVNQQIPLPKILVNILNANKALEQSLINMRQQLESEQPFMEDSAEYNGLLSLYRKLRRAQITFLGSNLSQSDIYKFNTTCANAITEVEQSDLGTTPYWSAPQDGLKNKLGCIDVVCNSLHLLNVNKALQQNLTNMKQQLENEQPFKKESAEYHALSAFHGQLQEARTTVLSSNLSESDIARFKKNMSDAIAQAEQSNLRHHLGWWAEIIKPILIGIALLLTLFTALIIPVVRESTSHAFWKPTIDSFNHAKSKIAEYSM